MTVGLAERVLEAALTEQERARLPNEDFAVPHKRLLPIHDATHARLAWDMLDKTGGLDHYERQDARTAIMRALHRHGVGFGHQVQEESRRQLTDLSAGNP